jgi:hypothetical protein
VQCGPYTVDGQVDATSCPNPDIMYPPNERMVAPCEHPVNGACVATDTACAQPRWSGLPGYDSVNWLDKNKCPWPACAAGKRCQWRGTDCDPPQNGIVACMSWAAGCGDCPFDTYKSTPGAYTQNGAGTSADFECTPCAAGKITLAEGSTSETDCVDPPATATATANETDSEVLPKAAAAQASSTAAAGKFPSESVICCA